MSISSNQIFVIFIFVTEFFIPELDYQVFVCINYFCYSLQISRLDAVLFFQNKILTIPIKFCKTAVPFNVNVYWFMFS